VLQKAKQYIATIASTHHMSNAAVIILDYHNGAIRSLIGSLDSPTSDRPLNVVTQKDRQVGSVFKPFVYANAFGQGISPGEVVYDGPFSVGSPPYTPRNYDARFHGYMSYIVGGGKMLTRQVFFPKNEYESCFSGKKGPLMCHPSDRGRIVERANIALRNTSVFPQRLLP
jgi:cell division protein FtsI/penicillin-binding protein 2